MLRNIIRKHRLSILFYASLLLLFFAVVWFEIRGKILNLNPFDDINSVSQCDRVEAYKRTENGQKWHYALCYKDNGIVRMDDLMKMIDSKGQ